MTSDRARTDTDLTTADPAEYCFAQFRLDVRTRQLWHGDQNLHLSSRVFETLFVLVRHRDRVVTKEELVKAVWPDSFVTDESLTQCIWSVRRALGDDASQPQFVVTVPRRGYRFIAAVTADDRPGGAATNVELAAPPVAPAPLSAPPETPAQHSARTLFARLPTIVAVVATAGVVLLSIALVLSRRTAPGPRHGIIRAVLDAPSGTSMLSDAALSPDSTQIAFVAKDSTGRSRIWLRVLRSGEARSLVGTDGASRPFWSPGSDALGFFASGRLKVVGINSSSPRTLAEVGLNPAGGTWSPSGSILFAGSRSGLQLVQQDGGAVRAVTTVDDARRDIAHRWPQFLPDGRRFIYTVVNRDNAQTAVYVGSVDGAPSVRLLEPPARFAAYVESGHLLYIRDDALIAQPIDPETLRLLGPGRTIAGDVSSPDVLNGATISATREGLLTLRNGRAGGQLVWFDRSGTRLAVVDTPVPLHNLSLSPDGHELLADTNNENSGVLDGVWRLDLVRGTRTRIGSGSSPIWSPDGRQIAFATGDRTAADIYLASAATAGEHQLLLRTPEPKGLGDWSRDGRYIVYRSKLHLWVLPLDGQQHPTPFLQTPFEELQARISPDGHWLAYTSDESGRWEVYVQSFPTPGTKHAISTAGGAEPQWRGDGRELYYISPNNVLMSVAVAQGATWQAAIPRPLFTAPLNREPMLYRSRYQVTADGERILMDVTEDPKAQEVALLVNWFAALEP